MMTRSAADEEVCELVDGALDACRQCKDALGTIVALLPKEVVAKVATADSVRYE